MSLLLVLTHHTLLCSDGSTTGVCWFCCWANIQQGGKCKFFLQSPSFPIWLGWRKKETLHSHMIYRSRGESATTKNAFLTIEILNFLSGVACHDYFLWICDSLLNDLSSWLTHLFKREIVWIWLNGYFNKTWKIKDVLFSNVVYHKPSIISNVYWLSCDLQRTPLSPRHIEQQLHVILLYLVWY